VQLYELCQRVSSELERRHAGDPMGLMRAKGELATRTGFLAGMVGPNDSDDAEKTRRLRDAASAIGISI
jgi:hypothetical protein